MSTKPMLMDIKSTLSSNPSLAGQSSDQNFENLLQACRAGDLEKVERYDFSCLYGALTPKIKELLLSYKFTKAVDETQPYRHFLLQLFEQPLDSFYDVIFRLVSNDPSQTREFAAHRWEVGKVPAGLTRAMVELGNELDLGVFAAYFDTSSARRAQEYDKLEIQKLQEDLEHFFRTRIIRDQQYFNEDQTTRTSLSAYEYAQADFIIDVDDEKFPCHRAFITRRSDYFKALFTGPFAESISHRQQDDKSLPVFKLSGCTPEMFILILEFIYTDKCEIPPSIAYDVLIFSDMYLLDKLKSLASISLTNLKEPTMNIYTLMRTAIDLNVERLESWCSRWFADHINEVLEERQFLELVKESAESIKHRQETDTIPLIDDIRYWLSKKYGVFEDDIDGKSGRVMMEYEGDEFFSWEVEYNETLERIDKVLEKLELDA
ncbi:16526_t:CDS:2 [Acaulospora colombiana]|uniref:16526_t:CDS:1 n=1 Tax=Acaulospora colombiana TaxID=27376 RepID=A0ACA9LJ89_9GLOM|nr:16526_t:CDS:2 [Acaulospora colombiana]